MHWKERARNQLWKTEVSQLSWGLLNWVEEYQEEHCKNGRFRARTWIRDLWNSSVKHL